MPNMDDRRYPVEPLFRLAGIEPDDEERWAKLGRATGIGANTTQVVASRHGGTLSEAQADEWATGLGVGPEIVWDGWYEDVDPSGVCKCKRVFIAPGEPGVCDRCGRQHEDRNEAWAKAMRQGTSGREIARLLGIHENTVYSAVRKINRPRRYGDATERIIELRRQGVPIAVIAKRTRKSKDAVRRTIYRKVGDQGQRVPFTDESERERMREMKAGGHTNMSIAQATGRNICTVRKILAQTA